MTGLSGRPPSGPHARRPGTASSAAGGGVRNALAPHTYQLPGVGGQKEPRGHEMPGAPRALRSQAHMARGGGERRGGQDAGLLATGAGALTSGPGAAGREGGGGPAGGGRVEESQARGRAESWISSGRDSSPGGSETSRLASDGVPGTAAQTQTVPVPVEKPSLAVIKVVDQGRGEEKEFKCHLSTLVEHMQYFESYLDGVNVSEKVEISVFCDVGEPAPGAWTV